MLSNYPPGVSDNTVGAPWTEDSVPEKEFDVMCSQTLSKSVTVWTNNYVPGASGCDYEDGIAIGWQELDDISETNWADEYHDNDHYTPLELINKFKKHLMKQWDTLKDAEEANDAKTKYEKSEIQHLIEECDGWCEDDVEFVKDE